MSPILQLHSVNFSRRPYLSELPFYSLWGEMNLVLVVAVAPFTKRLEDGNASLIMFAPSRRRNNIAKIWPAKRRPDVVDAQTLFARWG